MRLFPPISGAYPDAVAVPPLVGWDLAWPSAFRRLLLLGAEMIIAPTYWTATDAGEIGLRHNPHSEKEYLECLVKTRAWENECALLVRSIVPLCFLPVLTHSAQPLQFTNVAAPASWSPGDPIGNEEGRIGCSQVCLPFKGAVAHAVRRALSLALRLISCSCPLTDCLYRAEGTPGRGHLR